MILNRGFILELSYKIKTLNKKYGTFLIVLEWEGEFDYGKGYYFKTSFENYIHR